MILNNDRHEYSNLRKPVLWIRNEKILPPRPEHPESYPKDDFRHWYDLEYIGWGARKVNIPRSPADGPKGKRLICLLPGTHPYITNYEKGVKEAASIFKMEIEIKYADWEDEIQAIQVDDSIASRPDLIIMVPVSTEISGHLYAKINQAGIPVIASNMTPESEAYQYILAWTGPDDWLQCRKLAGEFARLMNYRGNYCIVGHFSGCSAYYARKWGIISELKRIAPDIKLLEFQASHLEMEETYQMVKRWIETYGDSINGIFSAGDATAQLGINKALDEYGITDIVRVAVGSTNIGKKLLKTGKLDANSFQAAELDGALPIQVAVDWFNGLTIPPFRYLPVHVITAENVDEFEFNYSNPEEINLDPLYQNIMECKYAEVEAFFHSIQYQFFSGGVNTIEYFRGFSIELLSNLINIIKSHNLSEKKIIGSYEAIFKKLVNQQSIDKTLEWLNEVSSNIITHIKNNRKKPPTLIQQIVTYVQDNYAEPLSLKVISQKFNISAAYLGKLFKEETGDNFTNYLNKLRIDKAKQLMRETPDKANKIALDVGYSDANYFYGIFKKYTGSYPSEYMEQFMN